MDNKTQSSIPPDSKRDPLREHSRIKVRLLGEYLRTYFSIVGNDAYTNSITIRDLFCGEGKYKRGGEGSPLIIMRSISDFIENQKGKGRRVPPISIHFNDEEEWKIQNVKDALREAELDELNNCTITFTTESYAKHINSLLGRRLQGKNFKEFIFIDPYGYKNVSAEHIRDLVIRQGVEVLLFVPIHFMYRFESIMQQFIAELLAIENWNPSTNAMDYALKLKSAFQMLVGTKGFADHFFIRTDNKSLFCLYFFCHHIKALEMMLSAKWRIDKESGTGLSPESSQFSLFSEFPQLLESEIEPKLLEFLSEKPRGNGEVYEFILREGFLPAHTTAFLLSLQDGGILAVSSNRNENRKRNAFYLNSDNYKKDPNRITFSICHNPQ
jgi:three-Cys-motif partner protein